MSKKILFNDDARQSLKNGIDAVANAVKITLGPRGRNVVFDRGYGAPTITNDGVSIAKEITLKDKFENMGAEIVKEVANKTNESAGDGTTTSVVLTQAIAIEGLKRASMGANGLRLRAGIDAAAKDAIEALRGMAKPIKNREEVKQVATISAESAELGAIIAETIQNVGTDGVVTVEESQSFGVESEVVEGMEIDKGYVSPYMVTNPERMEAEYSNAPLLITDKKISTVKEILPLLEKLAQAGKKELVIIAEDVDGEALTTFVLNKIRGAFNILAIKAPGFGDRKKEQLQDIAIMTGATVITEDTGMKLDAIEASALGKANKIIATKDKTVIVGGKGKKADIEARVAQLKAQIDNLDAKFGKFDRENLEKRVAKLAGGVGVIRVGAATETEMKYLKLKIEDAVNATKAAIEEGIVPGGGVALAKVSAKLAKKFAAKKHDANSEFAAGYQTLVGALTVPLKQIAVNAGRDEGSLVVDKVVSAAGDTTGYDAGSDEHGELPLIDMLEAGIIDPVKVTRTALQNAASAAGILLTTEVAIAEEAAEEKNNQPPMGMPGY